MGSRVCAALAGRHADPWGNERTILPQDIKAAARSGNMAGAKILAQQLVRLRGHMAKMQTQAANLRGVNISMAVSGGKSHVLLWGF